MFSGSAFSESVRAAIDRAIRDRLPRLAEFSDGAYVVLVGDHETLALLVLPAPDGAACARDACARYDALREHHSMDLAVAFGDLSTSGTDGEGLVLLQVPRSDHCAPLTAFRDVEVRAKILADLHTVPALAAVPIEDVWMNTTNPNRPTPFLIRTDHVMVPT